MSGEVEMEWVEGLVCMYMTSEEYCNYISVGTPEMLNSGLSSSRCVSRTGKEVPFNLSQIHRILLPNIPTPFQK